ncbi:11270_t:CDS:2 [Cetraspora pellucida]|uniref:11270_t:CDS:1 n=1 Tax=Cetraspora pellucida TaxID=1433469 RepID=A0ACA9KGM3_9GLOM|nr:11270_t:CDS:2 [Cetraspora pellucida]
MLQKAIQKDSKEKVTEVLVIQQQYVLKLTEYNLLKNRFFGIKATMEDDYA